MHTKTIRWIFPILFFFIRIDSSMGGELKKQTWSAFPIVMYDSDIGLGIGGKGIVKNLYRKDESFDLILFGSTRGEQWAVFTFSIPDFEIRQGRQYPLAFDLKIEFDKLLKSNYFGIGNGSADNDFQFPREFLKLEATAGRAFLSRLIGEITARYAHYSTYGFRPEWGTLSAETPGAGETSVSGLSVRLRYDSRDSQIHPRKGMKADVLAEQAFRVMETRWNFRKLRFEWGAYRKLLGSHHILALRFWAQAIRGDAPFVELSKIGDSWTARGFKADRFLDKTMCLASAEYRFPVYRKLGGVAFIDAGRVWPDAAHWNLRAWHSSTGAGLRYYLENFVVRFDAGFSNEGTRIFFNFGHVF
ncbi:BamA/TamA family outer membrane protein [bacterium]|nr:BamA/TamA family outer membrane protein [bacterium]